jgi:WD40 repeat protein
MPSKARAAVVALLVLIAASIGALANVLLKNDESPTTQAVAEKNLRPDTYIGLPERLGSDPVTTTAVAPNGAYAVGTKAGQVYRGQVDDPRATSVVPILHLTDQVSDVTITADGSNVAAVAFDGSIGLTRQNAGPLGGKLPDLFPESVTFNSDGSRVAFGGFGVWVFNARTGAVLGSYEQPMLDSGRGVYEAVAFGTDGQIVAVDSEGVDVWHQEDTGRILGDKKAVGATRRCHCAADGVGLSSDGHRAAFGTSDGHVIVMDSYSGQVITDRTVSAERGDHVFAVALTDEGRIAAAAAASSGTGLLWDSDDQRTLWRGQLPSGVDQLSFVEDDALLLERGQIASKASLVPFVQVD